MKIFYAILGLICLVIGVLGTIMPGLPGVPFLLLTLFFFTKSSTRLHHWFIHTSLYHNHLKSLKEKRELTKKTKISILSFATIMLAIGFYFTPSVIGKVVIVVLLFIKYAFFFFWIKTAKE